MGDTKLKDKILCLMNPLHIKLNNYTNQVNKLLKSGIFISEYKSYDTNKNDTATFVYFDIKSIIKKNGIVLKIFQYQGNLTFTYNESNNKVCIQELPKYGSETDTIFIFTSDILTIIIEKLKDYVKSDELMTEYKFIGINKKRKNSVV